MKAVAAVELKRKEEGPEARDFGLVNDLAEAVAVGLKEEMREKRREARRIRKQERPTAEKEEPAESATQPEVESETVVQSEAEAVQELALMRIKEQDELTKELREAEERMQRVKERRAAGAGWVGTGDRPLQQRVTGATFNNIKAPAVKHSSSSLFKWDSSSLLGNAASAALRGGPTQKTDKENLSAFAGVTSGKGGGEIALPSLSAS